MPEEGCQKKDARRRRPAVGALVLVLLLTLILFGLGFTLKVLWWVALVLAVVWLIGVVRPAQGRRFYRW
jgi:Flp pilus assembly protein TadB